MKHFCIKAPSWMLAARASLVLHADYKENPSPPRLDLQDVEARERVQEMHKQGDTFLSS